MKMFRTLRALPSGQWSRVLPIAGPIAFSGANLAAAMFVQQNVDPFGFGLYAFIQILLGTCMGLSDAVFGTPLMITVAGSREEQGLASRSFALANIGGSILAAATIAVFVGQAGASPVVVCGATINGLVTLVRWHLRNQAMVRGDRINVVVSDLSYSAVLFGVFVVLYITRSLTLEGAILAQIMAGAVSKIPLPRPLLTALYSGQWGRLVSAELFLNSLKKYGGWSLVAAVATNAVANFHAYFVTLTLGAATFAPIALAMILFRPLGVVLTGLIHSERPKSVRWIKEGETHSIDQQIRFIRRTTALAWLLNLGLVALVFALHPDAINREGYDRMAVVWALVLVALLTGVRAMREPQSSVLQAAGEFKALASITLISAPVTVVAVVLAVIWAPGFPAMVLLGAALGEAINYLLVERKYRRVRRPLVGPAQAGI